LTKNNFSPNAISHKDLTKLFDNAKKETSSTNTDKNDENNEIKEFNDLISNWTKTSQEVLLKLKDKENILSKNRNSKSLLAYGAMGAHLNMALQALKAAELDQ